MVERKCAGPGSVSFILAEILAPASGSLLYASIISPSDNALKLATMPANLNVIEQGAIDKFLLRFFEKTIETAGKVRPPNFLGFPL
jgi:hypothetical protein